MDLESMKRVLRTGVGAVLVALTACAAKPQLVAFRPPNVPLYKCQTNAAHVCEITVYAVPNATPCRVTLADDDFWRYFDDDAPPGQQRIQWTVAQNAPGYEIVAIEFDPPGEFDDPQPQGRRWSLRNKHTRHSLTATDAFKYTLKAKKNGQDCEPLDPWISNR